MENSSENYPTITLKKGKTEIKVQNAAEITKKINQMYPHDGSRWYYSYNKKMTDEEKNRQTKWNIAAKDWFRQEIFGGIEDFEVIISQPEPLVVETVNETVLNPDPSAHELRSGTDPNIFNKPSWQPLSLVQEPKTIPSVNKNAYEIRTDVLGMALDWVKWQTQTSISVIDDTAGLQSVDLKSIPTGDQVLEIARKFYSFVENRR